MVRLFLSDGTERVLIQEEARIIDLTEICNGKMIIKTEFFEESGK